MWNDFLKVVRLLLLHGANPFDVNQNGLSALDRAEQTVRQKKSDDDVTMAIGACEEMQLYLENPIRYHSDCSALIQSAIGLASLDLPVLLVTLISEYLVSINEEKFFGEYSEQKSWDIASLIKKKAQIEN